MTIEKAVANGNYVFFGGSMGVGLATATALAERGANILIVGRGQAAGDAAVAQLKAAGAASAAFLAGDLSTLAGVVDTANGVKAWSPQLDGVMHTAMSAFRGRKVTTDGLDFAFALQYLARAMLNRLLADALAASGDGRIVHLAGDAPLRFMPDLDDLQYERSKWGFFKSVWGSHILGYLHVQEAQHRWADRPVSLSVSCILPTKTKIMLDPAMPLFMRLAGAFGATPQKAATNAIRIFTRTSSADIRGVILRSHSKFTPEPIALPKDKAARLWEITTRVAAERGVALP